MANLIPGINVGNLFKQAGSYVGLAPKKDYDILDNISVKGGDRSPSSGGLVGIQRNSATPSRTVPGALPSIEDLYSTTAGGAGGGGDGSGKNVALINKLRGDITGRGGDIDAIYNALFGDLDNVVRSRGGDLEAQYGDQFKKASEDYSGALPTIENSYAAIGSADSTDRSDAKDKAKKGFEETTATIGKNKQDDFAKLGAYANNTRAELQTGRESAARNVARAGETEDTNDLSGLRSDLESNLDKAAVTRSTLGTDGQARQAVTNLTADNGRSDAAISALDSIIKGSMSGAVKDAAVQAVVTNGGLSDEDKKKVQAQFGNTYAEQAAL